MRTILLCILTAISIHAQDRGPSPATLPEPAAPTLAQDSLQAAPTFREPAAVVTARIETARVNRDSLEISSDRETRKAMLVEAKSMASSLRVIATISIISFLASLVGVVVFFAS